MISLITPKESLTGCGKYFTLTIDKNAVFDIKNNDNYCLFYVIEIVQNFYMLDSKFFYKLKNNQTRLKNYVIDLIEKTSIDKNLDNYNVEIPLPMVQKYFNNNLLLKIGKSLVLKLIKIM